jgi:N-acetylglucosamine kinase-like BadF-type ATPase
LAGDEGGGVGIARDALHAVAKASDGRGLPTKLSKRASEYFRAAGPENLIVAIYSPQVDNARIAGFAREVVQSALDGDNIAVGIIEEAGRELGIAATAVIQKLKLERKKIPIGCVGSIFNAGSILTATMAATVNAVAPKAFLTEPQMPPSHAAALMAKRNYSIAGNGSKS